MFFIKTKEFVIPSTKLESFYISGNKLIFSAGTTKQTIEAKSPQKLMESILKLATEIEFNSVCNGSGENRITPKNLIIDVDALNE